MNIFQHILTALHEVFEIAERRRLREVARRDQLQAKLEARLDDLNKPYKGLGDD